MDQSEDQADLRSTLRSRDSQAPETEDHDWWQVENQLERKQLRSRAYQETHWEINRKESEKPRKRGKAHNRRGQNDHVELP